MSGRGGGGGEGLGGHTFILWGSCQTAGPIGTKFGTHLWIHLGMDRLKQLAPRYPRAALWVVLWDQQFKRLGNCGQTAGRIGNQFCTYNADESGNGQN